MKRQILCLFVSCLVLVVFLFPAELFSAPYYDGKVIRLIVGHEPGGGNDQIARIAARYLPKYIPGQPSVIVENMPGAGTLIAANYLHNVAKPDGLTIAELDKGNIFAQLFKVEGVKFEVQKFNWLASSVESITLCIRRDLPYKTIYDLLKADREIKLATTGPVSSAYQYPVLLREFVGLKLNLITYPGSAADKLAIRNKEADGKVGSYSSMKPLVEEGLLRVVLRGEASEPGIEDVPIDVNFIKDDKGKTLIKLFNSPSNGMARPFYSPPGTPADVTKILRDAFTNVFKDQNLRRDFEKVKINLDNASQDQFEKSRDYLLNQPEDMIKELSKYVKF